MAIPKRYLRFMEQYPEVGGAYEQLNAAVQSAGPLDRKTLALVKLAVSTGARMDGAVRSHARKALAAGANADELRQVALMALPTIGFPSMMAALKAIEEVVPEAGQDE